MYIFNINSCTYKYVYIYLYLYLYLCYLYRLSEEEDDGGGSRVVELVFKEHVTHPALGIQGIFNFCKKERHVYVSIGVCFVYRAIHMYVFFFGSYPTTAHMTPKYIHLHESIGLGTDVYGAIHMCVSVSFCLIDVSWYLKMYPWRDKHVLSYKKIYVSIYSLTPICI